MKKYKLFTFLIIFSCLILNGCFSPIFYEIMQDVKPEQTTIKSPVNQITRFKASDTEFLTLVSDQGIRYKRADSTDHDEWIVYNYLPVQLHYYNFNGNTHEGEMLLGIYASSNTLYLVTAQYDVDTEEGIVYPSCISLWGNNTISSDDGSTLSKGNWEKLICDDKTEFFPINQNSASYYQSAFCVFQTNAVKPDHRAVFIRTGNSNPKIYKLNGLTKPDSSTPYNIPDEQIIDFTEDNCIRSVVYFGNDSDKDKNFLFFNSYAAVTNETKDKEANKFYYGAEKKLMYGYINNESTGLKTQSSLELNNISALEVSSDAIFIGCAGWVSNSYSSSGGFFKTTLNDEGIPGNDTVAFSTNANFQIQSTSYITVILNATPDKTEKDSCLYCGTQIFGSDSQTSGLLKNVGLWSYYPTRGNWNRE